MKNIFLFLCMFCSLIGCAPGTLLMPQHFFYTRNQAPYYSPKEVYVYIHKDFGAEDRLHLDDALNTWNYALNGSMKLVVKSENFDMGTLDLLAIRESGGFAIIPVNSTYPYVPKPTSLAWADLTTRNAIYIIRDRVKTQDIFGIMLHEVGHILGAYHIDSEANLMYPDYYAKMYVCIDRRTIQQVAEFQHLNYEYLNACIYY